MGKSGPLKRYEPNGATLLQVYGADTVAIFREPCWEPIFELFTVYDLKLTSDFIDSFNNNSARVQGLLFQVTEESIIEATKTPVEGQRWFKRQMVRVNLNYFLKDDNHDHCWSVGVHINILKP